VVVKRIRGARGAAKVALACIGIARESCRGKLKLFLKSHLTLASVRYSVAAGRSRKLTIKLSGRGRRLLARSGRLHVKLVVVQRVGRINYVVGAKKLTIRAARTHS
jgi:hypothetical protein